MKKLLIGLLLIELSFLLFTSCKKYDNDSGIRLKTVNSRITGEWKVINETSSSSELINDIFNFENDGSLTYKYEQGTGFGSWELSEDKEQFILNNTFGSGTYTILSLTNHEFKIEKPGLILHLEKQ